MTLKQKIALQALKRKVDRGILTEEKAMLEFEAITGQKPGDVADADDQGAQSLGKYLDFLSSTTWQAPASVQEGNQDQDQEQDPEAQPTGSTVELDLNPPTDKMLKKRQTAKPKIKA